LISRSACRKSWVVSCAWQLLVLLLLLLLLLHENMPGCC
jgi:hypothetical protein